MRIAQELADEKSKTYFDKRTIYFVKNQSTQPTVLENSRNEFHWSAEMRLVWALELKNSTKRSTKEERSAIASGSRSMMTSCICAVGAVGMHVCN
jgi:hypothetical protein